MKKVRHAFFLIFFAVIIITACSDGQPEERRVAKQPEVRFRTIINSLQTRTTNGGDEWSTGDQIGVFMLMQGDGIADAVYANYRYVADPGRAQSGDNLLRPGNRGDSSIYYPVPAAPVEFIAYYPYGQKVRGINPVLPVDIGDQQNQAAIDVLYAYTSASNYDASTQVLLPFTHKMSKIRLKFNLKPGVQVSLANATARISGIPDKAELRISTGMFRALGEATSVAPLNMGVPSIYENDSAYFQCIVIPHDGAAYDERKVLLTAEGRNFTWDIPDRINFEEGKVYTYHITLSGSSKSTAVVADVGETIDPWTDGDEEESEAGEAIVPASGTATFITLPDGSVMETVYVRSGNFMMGSPSGEVNRTDSSEQMHQVTIGRDFLMGKYEVTTSQYASFLNEMNIDGDGKGPDGNLWVKASSYTLKYSSNIWEPATGKETHPVSYVSVLGAKAYTEWVGNDCRLPSEAEWEYTCRAGTQTAYFFGTDSTGIEDYAWYKYTSNDQPQKVGMKKPNAWNLYDMCGNVSEICEDVYAADYANPKTDYQTTRGGSFRTSSKTMRSAYRYYTVPDMMFIENGFRVVFDTATP
jgi:formylglycine-generating enzyme required for sulfatase activity